MVRLRAANALVDKWPALAVLLAIALLLPAQALAQTLAQAPTPASDALLTLPRDLSPWGMFMAADIVVKAVMVGLAFASVLTWTIWFAKAIELMRARRNMREAITALAAARSWRDAAAIPKGRGGSVVELIQAADSELRLSADGVSAAGVKERIASRFERIEAAAGRQMIRGTGLLATIGATAPFVGLFGTVWGIMNSFIGISKQHTTNLAVVAPGIAEGPRHRAWLVADPGGRHAICCDGSPAMRYTRMPPPKFCALLARPRSRRFEHRPADRRRAVAAE